MADGNILIMLICSQSIYTIEQVASKCVLPASILYRTVYFSHKLKGITEYREETVVDKLPFLLCVRMERHLLSLKQFNNVFRFILVSQAYGYSFHGLGVELCIVIRMAMVG